MASTPHRHRRRPFRRVWSKIHAMNRFCGVSLLIGVLALTASSADPVKPLEPINLPINTRADEDDPNVSSNNLTLYYVTNANKKLEIMASTRKTAEDPWQPGQRVPQFQNKDSDFRSPFLTTDGKYPQ